MKKPSYIAILNHKIRGILVYLRVSYLKTIGLEVGKGCSIGKIKCNWPSRIGIGNNVTIEDDVTFWVKTPFDPENYIKLGDSVFLGSGCKFNCASQIIIGSNCLIASNTLIVDVGHESFKEATINSQPVLTKEIVFEEDVWIGASCTILKGITLGKGCIIGAHSLVNKSVPPYEIWGGVPAKKIGDRK